MEIWFSAQDRDRRVGEAARQGLDRSDRAARVHREPADRERHDAERLQRGLSPGQRAELHQPLSEPVLLGRPKSSACRRARGWSGCMPARSATAASTRWIERDDPQQLGRVAEREAWAFPSFFTEALAGRQHHGQLARLREPRDHRRQPRRARRTGSTSRAARDRRATGARSRTSPRPAPTSSRRRALPTMATSGSAMTGTSMASPFVTGVVGLMLAQEAAADGAPRSKRSSGARRSRCPAPSFEWTNDAGFGVIDPEACLAEVERVDERKDLKLMQLTMFQSAQGRLPAARRHRRQDANPRRRRDAGSLHARTSRPRWPSSARRKEEHRSRLRVAHRPGPHRRRAAGCSTTRWLWRVHVASEEERQPAHKPPQAPRPPEISAIWHNAFHDQLKKNCGADRGGARRHGARPLGAEARAGAQCRPAAGRPRHRASVEAIRVSRRIESKQLEDPAEPAKPTAS